jgi:exopolyphosphatase/guanosine-5'-triphosphate,3'-diphosphate pyrophosphatase
VYKVRIAAIDVGSNALKITVAETQGGSVLNETVRQRAAVRFGTDVFADGRLESSTLNAAVSAFQDFRAIIEDHAVSRVRAVATSAVRDAANGNELVQRIATETGIELEVIDGEEEAALVMRSVSALAGDPEGYEVVLDIGGGSLEVIVALDGCPTALASFPLGAVRLLAELKTAGLDERATASLLARHSHDLRALLTLGAGAAPIRRVVCTGGSSKILPKLARKILVRQVEETVRTSELAVLADCVATWTLAERIEKFELRADRADIMVIALEVLHWAAGLGGAPEILVCRAGLRHGVLLALAEEVGRGDRTQASMELS